jgi:hypothetical protein
LRFNLKFGDVVTAVASLVVGSFHGSLFMEVVELLLSKDVSVIDKNMSFCTLDFD